MEEPCGSFNFNPGVWTDGLVAILVREAVSFTSNYKKGVAFDGPVDPCWIVNMNTVLVDNLMLCLANGERTKGCLFLCVVLVLPGPVISHTGIQTCALEGVLVVFGPSLVSDPMRIVHFLPGPVISHSGVRTCALV